MSFVKVSKEVFQQFLDKYPNKLEYNFTGFCEPPFGTYNDFSSGNVWPKSVVAKIRHNELMKGHPAYRGELNDYLILEEGK